MRRVKWPVVALAGALPLLTIFSGLSWAKTAVATASYPKLHWKGTITMGAWVFTPTAPGKPVAAGQTRQTAFLALAHQFEHLYPGIHIKFLNAQYGNNPQFIITKAAGGQLADVWDAEYGFLNQGAIPQGIAVNLAPYFRQPNPYVAGNRQWMSYMNRNTLAISRAPNGNYYEVNGDYIATAFYYNKALFKKAGITQIPRTWGQLLADCRQLKAHGIIAGAERPYWSWWARLFLPNYLGVNAVKRLESYQPHTPTVTALDEVIGYEKGILNPLTNPRVMAWWPVAKQLFGLWDKNIVDTPVLAASASTPTGSGLFNAGAHGNVAMTYSGSWEPGLWTGAHHPLSTLGSFPLPSIAHTSRYATNLRTATNVGGPSGGYQWSISSPRADNSMKQPGKFQAVLDWLRFISTPKADQAVVNGWNVTLPTFAGSKPTAANAPLVRSMKQPWYPVSGLSDVSTAAHTQIFNLFQEYITGHLSLATAKQQYANILQTTAREYIAQHHIKLSQYK